MDLPQAASLAYLGYAALSVAVGAACLWWTRAAPLGQTVFAYLASSAVFVAAWAVVLTARISGTGWSLSVETTGRLFAVHALVYVVAIVFWLRLAALATGAPALAWLRDPLGYATSLGVAILLGVANAIWMNPFYDPDALPVADDLVYGLVGVYVAVVAIWTRNRAKPGSTERRRASAYLAAFLLHDVLMVLHSAAIVYLAFRDPGAFLRVESWMALVLSALLVLLFLPLLLYAVLSGRLLDVDSKFRITLKRTTLAAIFVGVLVAVQTLVSEYFTEVVGLLGGAVAAGLLVFALKPLHRFTDLVAHAAVPLPVDVEAFYREQVKIAYSDGGLGAKDRRLLRNLRERLGIDEATAMRIEETAA